METNDLTSLSWLHNLNIMDKLSAAVTAPPTPPASPHPHPSTSSTDSYPTIIRNIKLEPSSIYSHRKRPSSSSSAGRSMVSSSIASSSVASVTSITSADGGPAMAAATSTESIKEEEIDYKLCGDVKPPYSYASLICMAMRTNQHKMTLSSIYKWIKENFLYYRNADPSWQVTN